MACKFGCSGNIAVAAVLVAAGAGLVAALPSHADSAKATTATAATAAPKAAQHHFVMQGKGAIFDKLKDESVEVKLSAAMTEGRFSVQDEHWHPGFDVPPHFHKEHAEVFYLMDGQFEWTVNGEKHLMSAGDLVYIPPNTVHAVHVVGNKDAHVLFIYQPGGYEHYEIREMEFTAAEREKPDVQRKLREESDFNLAPAR